MERRGGGERKGKDSNQSGVEISVVGIILIKLILLFLINGCDSQDQKDLLPQVPNPHRAQGGSVQEGQGEQGRPGSTQIRSQTIRIRRADQAHLQEESQDHQEDRPQTVMHQVQDQTCDRGRPRKERRTNGGQGHQEEKPR